MTETGNKPKQPAVNGSAKEELHSNPFNNTSEFEATSKEHLKIIKWLKEVKFQKKLFGGVSEQDVWKKLEKLNEMYDAALVAERIRYDTLLEQLQTTNNYLPQNRDPEKELLENEKTGKS